MGASESRAAEKRPRHAGQFKPGQSGNPGGRRKSLAPLIQAATKDGAELVEFYVTVFRGEPIAQTTITADGTEKTAERSASLATRMEAAHWLGENGFGKPVQPHDLAMLDAEIERQLARLAGGGERGVPREAAEPREPAGT